MNRMISPLVLSLATAFAGSAHAQSSGGTNVTFYGVADGFVQNARGATNLNRLQSGGLSGSRFGLRGSEDLGGGLRGLFTLEAGINLDDGTFGQGGIAFGRQAFVGLQGGFGQLTLGRQYSSAYFASNDFSAFGNNPYGASTGLIGGFAGGYEPTRGAGSTATPPAAGATGNGSPTRVNNSLKYETPSFGGLRAGALYGFGEAAGSNSQRLVDVYARYSAGPLDAMVSLVDDQTLPVSATNLGTDVQVASIAGAYTFGLARVLAGYMDVNDRRVDNLDGKGFWVGGEYRFGTNLVRLQYVDNNPEGSDNGSKALGVGYQYDFSRRTAFYSSLTQFRNETNAGSGGLGRWHSSLPTGLTAVGDNDVTELAIGVRHTF
ncbi:MAG: porin [Burkholderiaceae bacterium]